MTRYFRFALVLGAAAYLHAAGVRADSRNEEDSDDNSYSGSGESIDGFGQSHTEQPDASQKVKRIAAPSFGPYAKRFKDLCVAMSLDGREEIFSTLLEPHMVKDSECPACYPFIRMFVTSCKVKKKIAKRSAPKPEPEEETEESAVEEPPPPPPARVLERDPNTAVVTLAGNIGVALAQDSKRAELARPAIRRVAQIVESEATLSPGSRDYFGTLTHYLEAAYIEEDEGAGGAAGAAAAPQLSEEELDAMFE